MINKNLMLVAMLSMGTALTTLGKVKPVAASLTPPASYDYSYTWNATASEQYLNVNGVDTIPLYTRTADGVYWNYTNTTTVIDGLIVTHKFNRSNTTWQASGTNWKPDEDKIGSDNTVGSPLRKIEITFVNNTNHSYNFIFDTQSSTSTNWHLYYDLVYYNRPYIDSGSLTINNIYLPSYSEILIFVQSVSTPQYLNAWYLQDLGVSESWQQGYDADTQGILTDYLGTDAQQIGWVLLGIAAILFVFKGGK